MNQPSVPRKLAFRVLVGMISVIFVEVPAGSTMFPFFTVWGLPMVLPLYPLHSVFLAGLVSGIDTMRPGVYDVCPVR